MEIWACPTFCGVTYQMHLSGIRRTLSFWSPRKALPRRWIWSGMELAWRFSVWKWVGEGYSIYILLISFTETRIGCSFSLGRYPFWGSIPAKKTKNHIPQQQWPLYWLVYRDIGILILAFDNPHINPQIIGFGFIPSIKDPTRGPWTLLMEVTLGMGIHDQMHPTKCTEP